MKSLPILRKSAVSEGRRRWLAKWLAMRRFDAAWGPGAESADTPAEGATPGPIPWPQGLVRPFDPAVRVGDVRLLDPRLLPGSGVPRYVAVTAEWEPSLFLLLPFAPYSVPAVTGELLTTHPHFSLAVLECWNGILAPQSVAARGWLTERLTAAGVEEAKAGFRHIAAGVPLPETLADRVGLPITTASDPRVAYQAEETAVFQELRAVAARAMALRDLRVRAFPGLFAPDTYAAAADSGEVMTASQVRPATELRCSGEVAESASPGTAWATCVKFDRIDPNSSGPVCCEWVIHTPIGHAVAALVYAEAREERVGEAVVAPEGGGLRIVLNRHSLEPGDGPVTDPKQLRIVILTEHP